MSFNLHAFQPADDPVMIGNASLNELWHSALTPESIRHAIAKAECLTTVALIDLLRWYKDTFGLALTDDQRAELNAHTREIVAALSLMRYLGEFKALAMLPPAVAELHAPEPTDESERCENCTCGVTVACLECNVPWPCPTVEITADAIARIDGASVQDG